MPAKKRRKATRAPAWALESALLLLHLLLLRSRGGVSAPCWRLQFPLLLVLLRLGKACSVLELPTNKLLESLWAAG